MLICHLSNLSVEVSVQIYCLIFIGFFVFLTQVFSSFISALFLKDVFLKVYRISGLYFFSFSPLKISLLCFLAFMISDEKSAVIGNVVFLQIIWHFSWIAFKMFFFVFSFQYVSAGDTSLIPGLSRSPAEGNGNPLQYSCLGNPMNRGVWGAVVHGVT